MILYSNKIFITSTCFFVNLYYVQNVRGTFPKIVLSWLTSFIFELNVKMFMIEMSKAGSDELRSLSWTALCFDLSQYTEKSGSTSS